MGDRRVQAFQISDELCDKFGYKKVTKEDKAKIFGLNAAKIYGVDVNEKRQALPKDTLSHLKVAYLNEGESATTPLTAGSARTCDDAMPNASSELPSIVDGRRNGPRIAGRGLSGGRILSAGPASAPPGEGPIGQRPRWIAPAGVRHRRRVSFLPPGSFRR